MSLTPESVLGAEKLTSRYGGCWPSFHDAELIELRLHRGNFIAGPSHPDLLGPELIVKIRTWIEAPGTLPTLATLRFGGVEDLEMSGFNHQNVILDLSIKSAADGFDVTFRAAFGLGIAFHCGEIEVMEAIN